MKKKNSELPLVAGDESVPRPVERLLWLTIAASALVLPLVISPFGLDIYRIPKELVFRTEAIVIVALLLIGALLRQLDFSPLRRARVPVVVALVAILGWTVISALYSTNRTISSFSIVYVVTAVVVFIGVFLIADLPSTDALIAVGIGGAIPNTLLAILQVLKIWNPFHFEATVFQRIRTTGLIGNPNDLGAVLLLSAIAACGYAFVRRNSIVWWSISALLLAGVLASQTLTAIAALLVAIEVMLIGRYKRFGTALAGAAALFTVVAFLFFPPLRSRLNLAVSAIRQGNVDELTSHRVVPFNICWDLFKDHPVVGAGPGTFKWHYLPYRMQLERRHPEYYLKSLENFGEAHSDHLQLLAESGLPGYLIFLGCAVTVGLAGRRVRGLTDRRSLFVSTTALPLAAGVLVVTISSFPLELSAFLSTLVFFSALLLRWSSDATHA